MSNRLSLTELRMPIEDHWKALTAGLDSQVESSELNLLSANLRAVLRESLATQLLIPLIAEVHRLGRSVSVLSHGTRLVESFIRANSPNNILNASLDDNLDPGPRWAIVGRCYTALEIQLFNSLARAVFDTLRSQFPRTP
jgi:hypothetical protein